MVGYQRCTLVRESVSKVSGSDRLSRAVEPLR